MNMDYLKERTKEELIEMLVSQCDYTEQLNRRWERLKDKIYDFEEDMRKLKDILDIKPIVMVLDTIKDRIQELEDIYE